jgi:hypothetical protein
MQLKLPDKQEVSLDLRKGVEDILIRLLLDLSLNEQSRSGMNQMQSTTPRPKI